MWWGCALHAVERAEIRILSASHNATSKSSGNPEEKSDNHLDVPQYVQSEDLSDEDEMYAREMRARDYMRSSKAKGSHKEDSEEDAAYDVDYGDEVTDESDDSEDFEDAGDEVTDDSDDSEDFEDAREVRFKTYPKGFKMEVCFVSH